MERSITNSKKITIRHLILGTLFLLVCLTQFLPTWAVYYTDSIYPLIALTLSSFSDLFPFAIGNLFITISIIGIVAYPFYARRLKKKKWSNILASILEYLVWIYVWFYIAWGLNYSQPDFFHRTGITYIPYTADNFDTFVNQYINKLNTSYTKITSVDRKAVQHETVKSYNEIGDSLSIHHPFQTNPRVKIMFFSPLISMVGVTGSMGPFFCEFTLNSDLLPSEYPFTYAHELAHRLGIAKEAEANFYAYQVCTRSLIPEIRFSGYFSILGHVLSNAYRLMSKEDYKLLLNKIRPEIIEQAKADQQYWAKKYNPFVGKVQDWIYDLYLKGNKIKSGRQNYSEVIGLLISYNIWKENQN